MESIKPIIKKSSTRAGNQVPELPIRKRKSVSFAPSPSEKPSKRRGLTTYVPVPQLKFPLKKPNSFIPSRHPCSNSQWPRINQTKKETSSKTDTTEMFELPSEPIEPFDHEKDWFIAMHASVSCAASPVHIVGITQNRYKRQCEGIEGLDERLLRGEVNLIFHPDNEYKPACETCWTIGLKTPPEVELKEDSDSDELELPGGWPKEPSEAMPHTHIYDIEYTGCKHEARPANPKRHCLRLVKGLSEDGGNGTMCRCSGRNARESEDAKACFAQKIETKILMPTFAGCPACEGKDLRVFIKTKHDPKRI